ncbi:MAG TPA: Hsp70 family protein, partial [Rhodanobacteraceae bacterium]|nr:Hsp70 family protein [Rhodanobacteraceae bacterium]
DSDLALRLRNRLRAAGKRGCAVGIDLGTSKSCLAWAHYNPDHDTLDCDLLRFDGADGARGVALPSVVAEHDGRRLFGDDALSIRGQPRVLPDRDWFAESKNLIGLRHSYRDAPDDLATPVDVAAALIGHLFTCAKESSIPQPVTFPLVVTVPASFHATQRQATLEAAARGFHTQPRQVRLLDEPCAAFIDLKFRQPERAAALLREGANVLVFDFGGGTCDVAIFHVDGAHGGPLGARLRGASRYHRLGGGDIDRAIVHDVLIPAWCKQHDIGAFELGWSDKRRVLEPQLLAVAERLKRSLSSRITELERGGTRAAPGLTVEAVDAPVCHDGRCMPLLRPSLSLAALTELLQPILDPEPPPESGDEFVLRSSLFAPVAQALLRARLEPQQIHGLLLCGSSSLLPPVQAALKRRFPDAEHVLLGDGESLQGAVARGAALQALSLQLLDEPIVAPVASADITLELADGALRLCRAGDAVPCASRTAVLLRPPRDSHGTGVDIAVELRSDGTRSAGRSLWFLPAPVHATETLELTWRMDDNQCVELRLERPGHHGTTPFVQRFDAPIMHRDAGQAIRARLLEREERIRADAIDRKDYGHAFAEHAQDCASLGEYEKALHYLALALQEQGENQHLLNLRGIWRDAMGNDDGAQESYERIADSWPAARFNLALLHYRQRRLDLALEWIDKALDYKASRPYHVLRGDILNRLGRRDEARQEWQDATDGQIDLAGTDPWALGWIASAASALENPALEERIRLHQRQRADGAANAPRQGELPARFDTLPNELA